MAEYESLVAEEMTATLDRAGFETLSPETLHVEITESFQRTLGDCRPVQRSDGDGETAHYQIRIARRLFDDACDTDWRDTVRHEVAHAHVFSTFGQDVQPHDDEWKKAARQAEANPTARYEVNDDRMDADYVLACPNDCFERGYLKRSKRITYPWKYACDDCETRLVSYDAADCPSGLEPGTCYVVSLPWETRDIGVNPDTPQTVPRFWVRHCWWLAA